MEYKQTRQLLRDIDPDRDSDVSIFITLISIIRDLLDKLEELEESTQKEIK